MGTRTHFLLRAAAIAVLVVEAAYPRSAPMKAVSPDAAGASMPATVVVVATPSADVVATR